MLFPPVVYNYMRLEETFLVSIQTHMMLLLQPASDINNILFKVTSQITVYSLSRALCLTRALIKSSALKRQ